jgi:hypothetical protein
MRQNIQVAWNHWDAHRLVKMREILNRHIPASGDPDYRGFEWYYLWRLANGSRRVLRGPRAAHSHPDLCRIDRIPLVRRPGISVPASWHGAQVDSGADR